MRDCTKKHYSSKRAAKVAAQRIGGYNNKEMRCYKCPHCSRYHITSQVANWKTMRDIQNSPPQIPPIG